jgi:hypothetical protein
MAKLQEYTKVSTMDPEESQVHVNLTEGKLKASCTIKRVLLGIVIVIGFCLAFFAFLCSVILIKKVNEFNKQRLNDAKDEIRFVRQISARIDGEIQQMRSKDKSASNTGRELRQSFEDIKDHLNVLIYTIGNLSAVVLRMNSSSDSKMSRLRWNLNATNNKLMRLQTELTQFNYSVNKTLHFKMAYHFDVCYSEVKTVEKELQENVENQIALANKTWHKTFDDAIRSLLSSVTKTDAKVDGTKQELQKSINNNINIQREVKDDFSKTKSKFQEKDRKHDLAISGHDSKMESMEERIAKLEDLKNRVEKMENGANGLLRTDIRFIFVLLVTTTGLSHLLN